jgi:hypothetical protein
MAVLFVVIGLLSIGKITGTTLVSTWRDTEIKCLQFGHQNLALHIHPILEIIENGEPVTVPANIGVSSTCMAEVHTHDVTGTIHVESTEPGKSFTLADFFTVWGVSIERNGAAPTIVVDGEEAVSADLVVLEDLQRIELTYETQEVREGEEETEPEPGEGADAVE